jgi:hypothetical protein
VKEQGYRSREPQPGQRNSEAVAVAGDGRAAGLRNDDVAAGLWSGGGVARRRDAAQHGGFGVTAT